MRVIPLGGCGEFGRNLTAYVAAGLLLIVDCGIEMPDDLAPGVDYFVPDLRDLLRRFGLPTAVLLTHGHEDHIGAVGHLLTTIGQSVPVYGRAFTLRLCQNRLQRHGVPRRLHDLRPLTPDQPVWFGLKRLDGPEEGMLVTPLAVPHSIPESCALLIQGPLQFTQREQRPLPAGAYSVLHTGDYKLEEFATSLGLLGSGPSPAAPPIVHLLVGDSTNAAVPGRSGSEREVAVALDEQLRSNSGRVAVTLFSSHISRIAEFAHSCQRAGRRLCLLGRGLKDAVAAATDCRILALPDALLCTPAEAVALPPSRVALLCTGSQGEAAAALGRLVAALAPEVPSPFPPLRLEKGDTVILSARAIPGHERVLGRLCDRLVDAGVQVVSGPRYTASGHGCSDELRALLTEVQPLALLPVHGTPQKLVAHAALAQEHGVPALNCRDGDVVKLSTCALSGTVTVGIAAAERLVTGHLAVEGSAVGDVGPASLRARRQLAHTGVVVVGPGPTGLPSLRVCAYAVGEPGPALSALCAAAEASASAVLLAAHPQLALPRPLGPGAIGDDTALAITPGGAPDLRPAAGKETHRAFASSWPRSPVR